MNPGLEERSTGEKAGVFDFDSFFSLFFFFFSFFFFLFFAPVFVVFFFFFVFPRFLMFYVPPLPVLFCPSEGVNWTSKHSGQNTLQATWFSHLHVLRLGVFQRGV